MSNPTPANTNGAAYTAPCPACGATLTSGIGGYLFMTCGRCQFHGQVMLVPTQPQPLLPAIYRGVNKQSTPGMVTLNSAALMAPFLELAYGDEQPAQRDEDRWRDALRQHVYELAASACGAMRSLTDADWRLPLWQVYERVQEAHGALYRALGERRMGDYPPGRMELDQALTTALLWQVMLLHAAERMREETRG